MEIALSQKCHDYLSSTPMLCSSRTREGVVDAVTIVFVTNDARFGGDKADGEKHTDTTKKRKS